jgi:polysaccharide pyruvyl transferase WcaK-like protein
MPGPTFLDFVPRAHLEGCLVVGYYGGGNYGDELLLELVLGRLKRHGVRRASFIYRSPARYRTFHRDFGYRLVDARRPWSLARALLGARSVVVGGGGLWGMDANRNVLVMSLGLFLARRLLGKPVYLLGVGHYRSAGVLGRVAAMLAAWGSTLILARDEESRAGFRRYTSRVHRDRDLACYIDDADLAWYRGQVPSVSGRVRLPARGPRAVFVGLRRFRDDRGRAYLECVQRLVARYPDRRFVIAALVPWESDVDSHRMALRMRRSHPNVSLLDFSGNPMAYLAWLREDRRRLVMISPHYHAIVAAHLNGVPLFPVVYDNKTDELLTDLGHGGGRQLDQVRVEDLCEFLDRTTAADRRTHRCATVLPGDAVGAAAPTDGTRPR